MTTGADNRPDEHSGEVREREERNTSVKATLLFAARLEHVLLLSGFDLSTTEGQGEFVRVARYYRERYASRQRRVATRSIIIISACGALISTIFPLVPQGVRWLVNILLTTPR